jgi:serine/threonine protein kinase
MYEVAKIWKGWNIVKLLGEGSFGKVYEIERKNYGIEERSALKVITIPQSSAEVRSLKNEGMDDESVTSFYLGLVKDFAQEIALMSKLKGNPGIVAYDDYAIVEHEGEFGWDIVIRMELLTPLADHMRINDYGEKEVVDLAIELCDALSLCHKKNVIHRDIKIDNIFVSDSGRYKLGDFGVARTIEKTSGGLSKKGTYSYMAPEVYRGEAYGHRADIYSLGMVLYKLLNYNREPFLPLPPETIKYTDKNIALVRRMKGEVFAPPVCADADLIPIIMKACAYLPDNRFSDSEEMKAELERIRMSRIQSISSPAEIKTNGESQCSVSYDDEDLDDTLSAFSDNHSSIESRVAEQDHQENKSGSIADTSYLADITEADDDERTMSAFSESSYETPLQDFKINRVEESQAQRTGRILDSNEWQCPKCGKIHYKYVGTCGCGEPKPAEIGYYHVPAANHSAAHLQDLAPVVTEEIISPITVVDNREPGENEWKCPKCGKIHYKYVGTCGCGESKPENVGYYYVPNPNRRETHEENLPKIITEEKPRPSSTVIDREPGENEWKCPKCGKIQYKYVGTCGCGETKPENVGYYYAPTLNRRVTHEDDVVQFSTDEKLSPTFSTFERELSENEWKCPKCGKIHYKYVGTCGCGQVKPQQYSSPTFSSVSEQASANYSQKQRSSDSDYEDDDRTISAFD